MCDDVIIDADPGTSQLCVSICNYSCVQRFFALPRAPFVGTWTILLGDQYPSDYTDKPTAHQDFLVPSTLIASHYHAYIRTTSSNFEQGTALSSHDLHIVELESSNDDGFPKVRIADTNIAGFIRLGATLVPYDF
jgi:hypothetical protein